MNSKLKRIIRDKSEIHSKIRQGISIRAFIDYLNKKEW